MSRTEAALLRAPNIRTPRFKLAQVAANSVLKELGFPQPPIPLHDFFQRRGWRICYEEIENVDGFMVKVPRRNGNKFVVFLSTHGNSAYDEETLRRRQYFTLAHELGHILLHGNFLLNSEDQMYRVPEEVAGIMEVEAHWFASRLLMPNYVFQNLTDLLPEQLAEKCQVNLTPAIKRIKGLEKSIRNSLIQNIRLDKWPKLQHIEVTGWPKERQFETWESYEEIAATSEIIYICSKCGLIHTERIIWDRFCEECEGELIKIDGIL